MPRGTPALVSMCTGARENLLHYDLVIVAVTLRTRLASRRDLAPLAFVLENGVALHGALRRVIPKQGFLVLAIHGHVLGGSLCAQQSSQRGNLQ